MLLSGFVFAFASEEEISSSSRAVGMWETRSLRFPKKKGNPQLWFFGDFPSSVISTAFAVYALDRSW
jgi:hypothetical protein